MRNLFICFCIVGGLIILLSSCTQNSKKPEGYSMFVEGCMVAQAFAYKAHNGRDPDLEFVYNTARFCNMLAQEKNMFKKGESI